MGPDTVSDKAVKMEQTTMITSAVSNNDSISCAEPVTRYELDVGEVFRKLINLDLTKKEQRFYLWLRNYVLYITK